MSTRVAIQAEVSGANGRQLGGRRASFPDSSLAVRVNSVRSGQGLRA